MKTVMLRVTLDTDKELGDIDVVRTDDDGNLQRFHITAVDSYELYTVLKTLVNFDKDERNEQAQQDST